MEQLLSHETHNNHIDSDDYLNQVKQEPPDIGSQKIKQTLEAMKHNFFTSFLQVNYVSEFVLHIHIKKQQKSKQTCYY